MSVAIVSLITYMIADSVTTAKRTKENQIAWNEYSKDMSPIEKYGLYFEWCLARKLENGWKYFYFPIM